MIFNIRITYVYGEKISLEKNVSALEDGSFLLTVAPEEIFKAGMLIFSPLRISFSEMMRQ